MIFIESEKYIFLYENKKKLLDDVLYMTENFYAAAENFNALSAAGTKSKSFDDEKDSLCEDYIALYDERNLIFDEIASIDKELSEMPAESNEINAQLIITVKKIIDLDDKIKETANNLKLYLSDSLKDMNMATKARSLYKNER